MPIYEFKCNCGHEEGFQLPMSQYQSKQTCKKCGKEMSRKVSAVTLLGMKNGSSK